jgi:hypothetical protein
MRLDEIYDPIRKYSYADSYKNYDQAEINEVIKKVKESPEFLELTKHCPLISSSTQLKHGLLAFQSPEYYRFTYDIDITGNIRANKGVNNRTRIKSPEPSSDLYTRYINCINELSNKLLKKSERIKKSFNIYDLSIATEKVTNLNNFDLSEVTNSIDLRNCNLTSLEGLPTKLNGSLDLFNNRKLESLEYCSEKIGQKFDIADTKITSLKYGPKYVGGDFIARNLYIDSLKYGPSVKGSYYIRNCKNLTSLEYIQSEIKGDFYCDRTSITSLEHCPSIIKGNFNCYNTKITSLDYAPFKCLRIDCGDNNLSNLSGIGRKYLRECTTISLPDSIKSNMLGLCRVKNLTYLHASDPTNANKDFKEVLEIIKKYLQTDGSDCAEELMQNGFNDYAKF